MNFHFPEASDHSGQKVLESLAQLQQSNALLKESLALSQKENVLQQELTTELQEQITQLKEVVEALEAEIRRLKKLPPKPDIKPNTKPPDDSDGSPGAPPATDQDDEGDEADPDSVLKHKVSKPDESTRNQRKQPPKPPPEKHIRVPACNVPPGSTWNGTTRFYVQDLVIKATSVEYLLDQWITPDGKTVTAKPPVNLHGHHYGPTLQAHILHQYYGCGVTQPQITGQL